MGILTLLRNAFGRSRKARTTEAEGATPSQTPEPTVPSPSPEPNPTRPPTASIPEPRPSTPDDDDNEHELVSAAFDKVTVPRPGGPAGEPVAETPVVEEPVAEEPVAETPVAEEPVVEEPVAEEPVAVEPVVEEPVAEEPVVEEPVTETPEPASAAADEPLAADGEDTPQGPPAPDDETGTGGAGGNNQAEGEAEAAPEPVTEDPAPDDETGTGGAGGNNNQAEGLVPTTLRTAYTAAATTLTTHNLTTTHAKIYLVLDRSASMRPYYKDGSAQALGDQALALAAHLDPDATVHVVFFSTELDGTGELTLADHETKIDDLHAGLGRMGRTSYHAAVEEITTHYTKSGTTLPALVIFQTDGAPDAKTPATQSLTEAAKTHPALFFSFVAFGEHDNKAFDYLRKLKTENTAFFHAGPTPKELTDGELYEGVLATWRP
ncbi:VWA domain-containing protein [Streptomyces sp. NPDC051963]|uniref:VWA domain-containing protein n=1 Tax=Streptomyces sp. NPDC051963 TaxID=3365678 RepID=UPI0037D0CCE1